MAAVPVDYNLSDDSDDDLRHIETDNDEDLVPDNKDITLTMLAADDAAEYNRIILDAPRTAPVPTPGPPYEDYIPEWTRPGITTNYEPFYRPALLARDTNPTQYAL